MNNEYIELMDRLCVVEDEIYDVLITVRLQIEKVDKSDENFVSDMQNKQAVLLRLVNKLNDIAMKAMAMNERSIVYKCENAKLEVRNTMEVVRNLYM